MKKFLNRKIMIFFMTFVCMFIVYRVNTYALDNDETRATWLTTAWNSDWPSQNDYSNSERQKSTLIGNFDFIKSNNLNTVFFQVKTMGDTFYPSNYAPWSKFLTGTLGKNPGYDPLKIATDAAHERGLEIHPWFNPFRISTEGNNFNKQHYINMLPSGSSLKYNPQWIVQYGTYHCLDIGIPEARKYVIDSILEVVKNYNIDGIHLDDYFYPYPQSGIEFPDNNTFLKYGQGYSNKDDWRRDNVNKFVKDLKNAIKSTKSYVKFGISPSGIWRNGVNVGGSNTRGLSSYDEIYVDSRKWVQEEWVDYIVPQIYWAFDAKASAYGELVNWWSKQVEGKNVHLYIGQAAYKINEQFGSNEIVNQINYNRKNKNVKGSSFFSLRSLKENKDNFLVKLKSVYSDSCDVPNMDWIKSIGWVYRSGNWYYYNSQGYICKNWQQINSKWYYFNYKGEMVTGWIKPDGNWYYLNSDGAMQNNWQYINGKWYYLDQSGAMQTGWIQINNKWYYMNSDGAMQTGWLELNGKWYHLDSNGARESGWLKLGEWYYLNSDGIMKTGWDKINDKWYYFNGSGAMETGWLELDNKWYHLDSSGARELGWNKINNKWYYMHSDGIMKTGWDKINGKWYYFNENGDMKTGWLNLNWTWYYLDFDGAMKTGWIKADNAWYYSDSNGAMQTGWLELKEGKYYLKSDGKMATGKTYIGNKYYFFSDSGLLL